MTFSKPTNILNQKWETTNFVEEIISYSFLSLYSIIFRATFISTVKKTALQIIMTAGNSEHD